jgi:hypothetical protein
MNGAIMPAMTNTLELPSWMTVPPAPAPAPAIPKKELQDKQFEIFFETILNKISQGINLKECLRDDQRDFDYTQLLRWIHKDPQRKSRYYEAQEIGSEMIAAEILEIADGTSDNGIPEDVQRSKLRIDSRQFLIKTWNRKRFGDVKTIELNQNISITAALEQAQARLPGRVIDIEDIE